MKAGGHSYLPTVYCSIDKNLIEDVISQYYYDAFFDRQVTVPWTTTDVCDYH